MTPVGITVNGLPVVSGVSSLSCTHGVPLELTLSVLKERGFVIDWLDYISGCVRDGHKPATIRARILSAAGDVYGPEYLKTFAIRLDAAMAESAK